MNVIIADPPWPYRVWKDKKSRTSDAHYPVMSMKELIELRPVVDEMAGDNTAMFMWTTAPTIEEFGLPLLKAWGFDYKTFGLVWVKLDKNPLKKGAKSSDYPVVLTLAGFFKFFLGMGHYSRGNIEVALLGIRGRSPVAKGLAESQLIIAPRREHSRKPDEQYGKIERLYPHAENYYEMFARQQWPGWTAWGNQTEKFK